MKSKNILISTVGKIDKKLIGEKYKNLFTAMLQINIENGDALKGKSGDNCTRKFRGISDTASNSYTLLSSKGTFMLHDVFISYSSKDRVIADAIVSNFENNDIRCWYAPRDIGPGDDWGEAITKAIDACPLFLLIFSGNANASKHVLDELYYSLAEEKVVIPFRVENLDPSGAMRLHLSSLHWMDAYDPSWETHIDRLFETVSTNLSKEISREREKFDPQDKIKSSLRGKIGTPRILLGVFLAAIITLSIVFGIPLLKELNAAI